MYDRAFYLLNADLPDREDKETVLCEYLKITLERVDDFGFERIMALCRSHWQDDLPPKIRSIEKLHHKISTSIADPWSRDIQTVLFLQETGESCQAQNTLAHLESSKSKYLRTPAMKTWLNGRQALLEHRTDDAKRFFLDSLKAVQRHSNRYLAAEIMLDLSRLHGIEHRYVREQRCLRIAEFLVREGQRPRIRELLNVRAMESALDRGDLQRVISRISMILDRTGSGVSARELSVACCFGIIVAGRMDKPVQALYYARELLQLVEVIPAEYLSRCRIAFGELRFWDPEKAAIGADTIFKRETALLKRYNTHPIPLEKLDSGIIRFFRFSQCLCDRLLSGTTDFQGKISNDYTERIKDAMLIAQRISDDRRWSRLAKELVRNTQSDPIYSDSQYPSGYFKWLNRWLQSTDRDALIRSIGAGLEEMFGIQQGFLLELRNNTWQWRDNWGPRPTMHAQRNILRNLHKSRLRHAAETSGWTLVSYPEGQVHSGYLGVGLHPGRTGEAEYSETINCLELLLKPLLVIRAGVQSRVSAGAVLPPGTIQDAADRILGVSPEIEKLRRDIRRIAGSPSTVHIWGETGTGKELVAQAIHRCSPRRSSPFVAFNCATCPESMIESELFGHVRGAFTGAHRDRRGVFLAAHGGTIFLDEIADLPLNMQAKLLRTIQERSIRPLGSDSELPVDIRIISATHKNLQHELENGRFRDDLYYRLVVISLHVPPLSRRRMDIPCLAAHFLEKTAIRFNRSVPRLDTSALKWLESYSWPGNVRELQNVMEITVNFADRDQAVSREDIQGWAHHIPRGRPVTLAEMTDRIQRSHIEDVLRFCDWNNTQAAGFLGISRQALFKKMKSLGIIKRRN